jgi:hypothetical protein
MNHGLKLSEVSASAREAQALLLESQRRVEETKEIALASIDALDIQHEKLSEVSDTLRHNDSMLDKSQRLLRGMTWTGRLFNFVEGISTKQQIRSHDDDETERIREFKSSDISLPELSYEERKDATKQLCHSVKELRLSGDIIGEKIKSNNSLLDRIVLQQDLALEKTFELTSRTEDALFKQNRSTAFVVNVIGDYEFKGELY